MKGTGGRTAPEAEAIMSALQPYALCCGSIHQPCRLLVATAKGCTPRRQPYFAFLLSSAPTPADAIADAPASAPVQVVIAESFGGRDEPVDVLASSLVDVGAELLAPALRVKDLPAQPTYQLFEEEGEQRNRAGGSGRSAAVRLRSVWHAVPGAPGRSILDEGQACACKSSGANTDSYTSQAPACAKYTNNGPNTPSRPSSVHQWHGVKLRPVQSAHIRPRCHDYLFRWLRQRAGADLLLRV